MSSGRASRRDADDDPDEEEEDEEEEEKPSRRPKRSTSKPASHPPAHSVRRWKAKEEDEGEEEAPEAPPAKRSGYWRARDSLYFEPLVALAIIVVLLVGLFAYTQNWPPVYVVESDSMQHGSADELGLINTGDLVLAAKISNSSITPYVVGLRTGYTTYGEYGDVLLYEPNGASGTPVIHRAILFLSWNERTHSYSAGDLAGLPCGNASDAVYATPGTPAACGTTDLTGTLDLFGIGWKSSSVSIQLNAPALGQHSGFLTMGDNNYYCSGAGGCTGEPDQGGTITPVISSLVEPGWVIGVARGMIPWFGSVKLLIEGQSSMVPPQSWQYLGLSIVGIILLAFGIHYALRREGIETPLRKKEDEERAAETEAAEEEPEKDSGRHWLRSLRPWHRSEEEDVASDHEDPASRRSSAKSSKSSHGRRGRPRPEVERGKKSRPGADDETEL